MDPHQHRTPRQRLNIAASVADEYWTPTKEWKFWEYISPEIEVLKELGWPSASELASAIDAYRRDSVLLKRFCADLLKQEREGQEREGHISAFF